MKLVALMLVKNEDWILGLSARVALLWCDVIAFYLHDCTDGTQRIVDELEKEYGEERIVRAWNHAAGWPEMDMRQALLEQGRKAGGTHFALIDADEVLTSNLLPHIRARVEALRPGCMLEVPMAAMWKSIWQYRDDASVWSKAWLTLAFRDIPERCSWKPDVAGYQHHHRHPYGLRKHEREGEHGAGGVMHLQFADWRRLVAKHAWYKMRERVTYPERAISRIDDMYSQAVNETGVRTSTAPLHWWSMYSQWLSQLHLNREPWHADACRRYIAEHGAETFAGLDLFGVTDHAQAAENRP